MEIRKGMYILPQAGIIYPTQLKMHLAPFGYKPFQYTPGLWDHENRDTKLCLVVDNFGIKYTRKTTCNTSFQICKNKLQYLWI